MTSCCCRRQSSVWPRHDEKVALWPFEFRQYEVDLVSIWQSFRLAASDVLSSTLVEAFVCAGDPYRTAFLVLRIPQAWAMLAALRRQIRHMPLHHVTAYELLGHRGRICTIAVHPKHELALTLDEDGSGLVWTCKLLSPEFRIPSNQREARKNTFCSQSVSCDAQSSACLN